MCSCVLPAVQGLCRTVLRLCHATPQVALKWSCQSTMTVHFGTWSVLVQRGGGGFSTANVRMDGNQQSPAALVVHCQRLMGIQLESPAVCVYWLATAAVGTASPGGCAEALSIIQDSPV